MRNWNCSTQGKQCCWNKGDIWSAALHSAHSGHCLLSAACNAAPLCCGRKWSTLKRRALFFLIAKFMNEFYTHGMEQNPSLPAATRQDRDRVQGTSGMVPPLGTLTWGLGEISSANSNTGEAAWLCVFTVSFILWAADNGKERLVKPFPYHPLKR